MRLLDGVDRVAAGIGEPDHLGAGALRLEQEGREVARRERHLGRAEHLAAAAGDDGSGLALERLPEGVIGGEEEPGIPAALDHGAAGAVRQRVGVVGPVDGIGRALRPGQVGAAGARIDEDLVLLAGDLADGERHRRGRDIEDGVDPVPVVPLPGDAGADIRLVLVVGGDDLDADGFVDRREVFHRQLRRGDRSLAADIGIDPRHVVQDADLDRGLSRGGGRRQHQAAGGQQQPFHGIQDILPVRLLSGQEG